LVVEWTTSVAPISIGRQSQGEAEVLSTISGMPAPSAMRASTGRSVM